MVSSRIDEFIQALEEEIKASKKEKTAKVFQGRFLREIAGVFVYVFHLENFLAVLDEAPAKITIRGTQYDGHILSTRGLEVEIGIHRFCGQFIPEASLETDPSYLFEVLKRKFEECQKGSLKRDFGLSEALFCGQQSSSRLGKKAGVVYSSYKDPPNEAQKKAIESSCTSQLCVIWGPPGTGKTKTVAKAAEAHLNAGRRVLLVSHANNAVDEALEDVAECLKTTPFYQEGKLVRLGKPQEEHLKKFQEDYELVLLDNIAAKLGESLTREKNSLEREKAQLEDSLARIEDASRDLQTFNTISSELDDLRLSLSESERRLRMAQSDLDTLEQSQIKRRGKLLEAQSAGRLKRLVAGLDPEKLQYEIDKITITIDSKMRLVREMTGQLSKLKASIPAKEDDAKVAKTVADATLQHLGISEDELESRKNELDQRKDSILSRIAEINRQLDEIQRNVLSEARLVATTLTRTFVAKQFPEVPFDTLIVDEASMAPLPHLYWAASHCRESVTIVGDFLQLPPICIAKKQLMAQKWLARSIFEVLGINSPDDASLDPRVTTLDVQYRMVPEISTLPNRLFYGNRLRDHPNTRNRKSDCRFSESPLVLVETSAMNPWCTMLSRGSRFNLYNALVCTTLARRIAERSPDGKIGIIAPYGPQARLIQKIAKDWGLLEQLRVSTVHRFQGGEEQIIIFDTTEGDGPRVAPMLDETKARDSEARLVLNVAITRAASQLYLVAHTQRLLSDLHRDSALARIIQHFQQEAETIPSGSLVDNYFVTDFEKWAEALLSTSEPQREPLWGDRFTEKSFWPQFFQDLKSTEGRLIIHSPFLTVERVGKLMDYFRSMVERGVEITVRTWPSNQHQGHMIEQSKSVIENLRGIGVKVLEGHGTRKHFKTAIIDNRILWDGSLNILSHRYTEEHMWRFEGPSAIEQIIRDLELDEDMPVGCQTEERCPEPGCDGFLVVRVDKKGRKFLGCSNYAKRTCQYTRPLNVGRKGQRRKE